MLKNNKDTIFMWKKSYFSRLLKVKPGYDCFSLIYVLYVIIIVSCRLQPTEAVGDWRKNIEDKADRKKMFESS